MDTWQNSETDGLPAEDRAPEVPPHTNGQPVSKSTTEHEEPALALPAADDNHLLEKRVRCLEEAMEEIRESRFAERPSRESALPLPSLTVAMPSFVMPAGVPEPPVATLAPDPAPPPAPPVAQRAPDVEPALTKSWLLSEMWAEVKAFRYMFFDPRYRMSTIGRVLPSLLLLAFLTTGFWLPGANLPGVGWLLQRAVELIIGFALFKVLSHEARRYRRSAPDLPPSLRL